MVDGQQSIIYPKLFLNQASSISQEYKFKNVNIGKGHPSSFELEKSDQSWYLLIFFLILVGKAVSLERVSMIRFKCFTEDSPQY